jgi:hypothetical protein
VRLNYGACAPAMLTIVLAAGANAEPLKVAVFPFELIDTSLEGELAGPREDEARRLDAVAVEVRAAVAAAGLALVDTAPVAAEAARLNLQACGGCDRTLAQKLGADWAVTGTVQKVSNLILNINLYVRDVASGEMRQAVSADIRGNTDESWRRGTAWLIRNRLKLPPEGAP